MHVRHLKAALAIGEAIVHKRADTHRARTFERKGTGTDYVTQVDHEVQEAVFQYLKEYYPTHNYLGEEQSKASTFQSLRSGGASWILDPIDGTTNYIHGFPYYCVSLAYAVRGEVVMAAIADPAHQATYIATSGGGTYCNDRRLRVSSATQIQDTLISYSTHTSARTTFDLDTLGVLRSLYAGSSVLRRTGSAAMDLAQVASGHFDATFATGLEVWDSAAGVLMVREAGGKVTTLQGRPDLIRDPFTVLAAPARLHDDLLALMQAHMQEKKPTNEWQRRPRPSATKGEHRRRREHRR